MEIRVGFVLRRPGLVFPPGIILGVLDVASIMAVSGISSRIAFIFLVEEVTIFGEPAIPGFTKETTELLLAISGFIRSINYSLVGFTIVVRIHSRVSVHVQISTGRAELTGAADKMRA